MPVFLDTLKIDNKEFPVLKIILKNKKIISIPTQIGCPVKCAFCISKGSKFERNLTSDEMKLLGGNLDQNTILSFTGEGEPLLNYKNINHIIETTNTIESFRICFSGLSTRRLESISNKDRVRLQFSMHSPKNSVRSRLITNTRPLEEIRESILAVEDKFKEIAINYVPMRGINDSDDDIQLLMDYVKPTWHIKLNPLLDENEKFQKSDRIDTIFNRLKENGFLVSKFDRIGSTIKNDFYSYLTYTRSIK